MKKTLLIVSNDPRTSPRPAEAFRVAAGLAAWGKLEVALLLVGEARRCRTEDASLWCDGRLIEQYRSEARFLEDRDCLGDEETQQLRRQYDQVIRW